MAEEKNKGGRPSIYTEELVDELMARIASGESLRTIAKQPHMPSVVTIFEWMRTKEGFSKRYAIAKEEQADALVEEMLDIADNGTNDWMASEEEDGGVRYNGDAVQRSRLRVDTRKWCAAKLKPKKYGDSSTIKHADADGNKLMLKDILGNIDGQSRGLPQDD